MFDLNEVAEKLVDIYKTFVIPNIMLIMKDQKCSSNFCKRCEYETCQNNWLTQQAQEMFEIGFLLF